MSEHKEPIPSMIYNASVGGHVTNSQQIIDENENKEQSQINAEVKQTLGQGGSVDLRIANAKSEIKGTATPACDTLGKAEVLISSNTTAIANEATTRDNAVSAEATRAQAAEDALRQLYENLTQSDIVVVEDHTQVTSPSANTIYREQGETSYSDWMYQNNVWKKMAEYNNAIDDVPTAGSDNLVKSGGVETYTEENYTKSEDSSNDGLDICDKAQNVIARFSNGHIKTKNFDSSKAATAISDGLMSAADKVKLDSLTSDIATQEQKGYLSAADKYKLDHVEDIYHSYDEATPIVSGLMSAADKLKLDNMVVQTPTISGSGMYKNAAAYGFLPLNDGATNADNLQSACDGGGTIVIDIPGVYEIKHKILLDSNTTLIFGANVFIKRVAPASPASGERWDYYSFINRGAYSKQWNENISIIGLHFLPNAVTFTGNPVQQMTTLEINGVCGHICFYYIKHLKVFDFDVQDSPEHDSQLYALHIQKFEDVVIENVNISYMKDGLHFSTGDGLAIRHCRLRTCDDSIAINACEYPDDVAELGWIRNVVIEDVVFVDGAVEDGWRFMQRYILLDVGAWGDWYEGMTVARHGSIVVSNGRIYRTIGNPFDGSQITYLTSRLQPTHLSGFQTYTDGQGVSITWYMAQDTNIVYNAGIENIVIKDIVIDRQCSYLILEDLEITPYSVQYQEGSDIMLLKNALLENIKGSYSRMLYLSTPFRNLKILKSHFRNTINCKYNYDISDDKKSTLFISACEFDEYSNNTLLINQGDRNMKIFCKNNFFIKDDSTIEVSGENIELITD